MLFMDTKSVEIPKFMIYHPPLSGFSLKMTRIYPYFGVIFTLMSHQNGHSEPNTSPKTVVMVLISYPESKDSVVSRYLMKQIYYYPKNIHMHPSYPRKFGSIS